jgi:hypothetical protein
VGLACAAFCFTTQDIMLENEKKKLLKKQFILLDTKKL